MGHTKWEEEATRGSKRAFKELKSVLETARKDRMPPLALIGKMNISMGPKTVMAAKSIVFLMSGEQKAEAVKRAFFGPISEDFPVSIFQLHPDVTVVLDEAAAGRIKELL